MKERVTLTIDQSILEQVDSTIDGSKVKNRSHAFELLVSEALGSNVPETAFIAAGGRKGSSTNGSMKKLGKSTVLHHNIELLKKHGVKDIIISVNKGNQGEKIKEQFRDGSKMGVNIEYVEEEKPLGTAGSLNKAREHIDNTFLMLNADEIKEVDLEELFDFHKDHGGCCTIALTTVANPSNYGVASMKGNKIINFEEKPNKSSNNTSNLINAGLYVLNEEVFNMLPEEYGNLEEDVFPELAEEENLYGYPFSGKWVDSRSPASYNVKIKKTFKKKKKE